MQIIRHLILAVVLELSLSACTTAKLFTPASTGSEVSSLNRTPALQTSYADLVDRDAPAVVTVRSERRVRVPEQFPFMGMPFLGEVQPRPQDRIERGLGSGVIVSADGYILTNDHVIEGAEDIRVELTDNRTLPAKVIGSDAPSDLAVLKIDASYLPVLPLGNSDQVRVGDVVLAIGNPLGVGQTVTMGIISAKGRQTGISDGSFEDFLQTDAPINQGNSGGALINTNGELIGINSQIISPSGGNIGIGFAVPANMAKSVIAQLTKSGTVRRGMLGVTVQPVTSDLASSLGLSDVRGALISSVQHGGPADRAGVQRGDVILALNGSPVADSNALRNQIANTEPGSEVTLTILHDKREQQIHAKLAALPASRKIAAADNTSNGNTGELGIGVLPLTPELASRLRLPIAQGLVVTDVDELGAAADAGIREGDVVVEANRQPVRALTDLQPTIQNIGSKPLLLLINRGGNTVFVTVRMRQ
ncbi:MAG TPA: DegQ family serine endoprotease [Pyrinomonadaceae bacterium]|nr:DegQ family serine endoprotease [Pyrinomonadaceae bacterium]